MELEPPLMLLDVSPKRDPKRRSHIGWGLFELLRI